MLQKGDNKDMENNKYNYDLSQPLKSKGTKLRTKQATYTELRMYVCVSA